jgi:hypothetical protein
MKMILRIVLGLLAALVLLIVVVIIGARFADGPVAIVAGGPFTSGELVTGPEPDWSYVQDIQEVEFQLVEPPRSRTTWILEHEGRIYIPSGYMTTAWGKLWKKWPFEALEDGRAILRIGDKLYERQLVRVEEGPTVIALTTQLSQKYMDGAAIGPEAVASGYLWLFELAPRS